MERSGATPTQTRRSVRRGRTQLRWSLDHGPIWGNSIGLLTFVGRDARIAIEQSTPGDDDEPTIATVHDVPL